MTYPATQDELTDGVPSDGAAPTTELDDASFPHDDHHRALAQTVEGLESVLGYGGTMPDDLLFANTFDQGVGIVGFPSAGFRFGYNDAGNVELIGTGDSAVQVKSLAAGDFVDIYGDNGVYISSGNATVDLNTSKLLNVVDPTSPQDAATKASQDAAVAAEAALARNGDNITSGTVADARIASTIARDSEVTAAVSAHESDTTSVHGITDTSTLYRSGGTDVAVADGGTGSSTASGARTNLDVPSNAEAVLDTLVDAKGDLLVGTAADTVARKAAGTNGYVLVAQSGASDGLTWQAQSGLVVNTVAAAGTTETLDGDDFNIHDVTLDENITFTFTTAAAVAQFTLILRQDGSGTNTVTWPASVKWHAATAPTILTSASAVHVLEFLTVDTGTTWRGFLASSNVS